ncbi:MAG: TatD family hydrolase [Hellea sp.]|nr:TatD family hydrolase [Hellea sp.]
MFVDSHVNLHGDKFAGELPQIFERAEAANVSAMLNICCNIKDVSATIKVCEGRDNLWASVGTHPHDAKDNPDITAADLLAHTDHPKVIGIGETGLDFHYNFSDRTPQLHNFQAHIEAVRESGLPLIIHSRNADIEMAEILTREMKKGEFKALLHCYTSGEKLARTAAELGCYFSMSGIITFKNAHEVRDIASWLPEDRIMIETDCPYLAPVPHRGRRCEPSMVPLVAEKLAEIRGWTIEETAQKTTDAFYIFFDKAKRPA